RGLIQIQFVQGQVTTCIHLAETAVNDYPRFPADAAKSVHDALNRPWERDSAHHNIPGTGGLIASLQDLKNLEEAALHEQRHSRWLDPAALWSALVGPVIAMLLLVLASGYMVARQFRRYVSPLLGLALLSTAAVGITT